MSTATIACPPLPLMSSASGVLEPTRRVSQEDEHWISRALEGNTAAFERLYRKHCGRVYALCLRMTGDAALAEELAQDAFVRAWEKLDTFKGNSQFSTWLYRLTVNVVLTALRSRGRRMQREVAVEELPEQPAGAALASPGTMEDIEKAIAQLPQGARNVFVLHDVEGYRHEEIASITGTATGTCKAQLHRARRLLREMLS